jgi:hypothetical protein
MRAVLANPAAFWREAVRGSDADPDVEPAGPPK